MTTLAMGRLQLTIALVPRAPRKIQPIHVEKRSLLDPTERALKTERLHQAVEADRDRWTHKRMVEP